MLTSVRRHTQVTTGEHTNINHDQGKREYYYYSEEERKKQEKKIYKQSGTMISNSK